MNGRIEDCQNLLVHFSKQQLELDSVQSLAHKMTIQDISTQRLQQLCHNWYIQHASCSDSCKGLQHALLQKLDFQQKCEQWKDYLRELENELAQEVSGDWQTLQRQKHTIEVSFYSIFIF